MWKKVFEKPSRISIASIDFFLPGEIAILSTCRTIVATRLVYHKTDGKDVKP
jgi:hypothetical protein